MKKINQVRLAKYSALFGKREPAEPLAQFCKKHGISATTYYRWKKLLPTFSRHNISRKRFVPVTVSPLSPLTDSTKHRYDIRFPNGATLQISGTLDIADLSAILHVVGKCAS